MTWLEGFEYIPSGKGGGWANDVGDKICLHTTEGSSIEGAVAAYRSHGGWPHFTVDPGRRRRSQHTSIDLSASALWNEAGGIETNRSGQVIQFEIVGFANVTHEYDDAWYHYLADCIRPVVVAKNIPPRITKFYGAGDGYVLATVGWVGRMNGSEWNHYSGIMGHQNTGENDHWDPGKLDAARLLYFTFGGGEIYDPVTDVTHGFGAPSVDFALQQASTEEQQLMASVDDLINKLNEIQTFVGTAFGGGVELYAGPDGVWRTAGLVDGRCTNGGTVVPQVTGLAYEAASTSRLLLAKQNSGGQVAIDYDRLADAVVQRMFNRIASK